jgi:hypothetical protein
MSISTNTLIWLFPIAFIFHDLEELVFLQPWLKKNAEDIRGSGVPRPASGRHVAALHRTIRDCHLHGIHFGYPVVVSGG